MKLEEKSRLDQGGLDLQCIVWLYAHYVNQALAGRQHLQIMFFDYVLFDAITSAY